MRALLFILTIVAIAGCGRYDSVTYKGSQSCNVTGNVITCPDGSTTVIPPGQDGQDGVDGVDGTDGQDGVAGADGQDGQDGQDAVLLTTSNVLDNACSQVYPNIYVENINNGEIFDVYANDQCKDKLGEYCDNVETSYGDTGKVGRQHYGGGDVCWIQNIMVSGQRLDNDSIDVKILDFN